MEPLNRPYRNSEEANGESMIPVERQPANSLRTRIAAVLVAHPDKMDGTCCGDPSLEIEVQEDWALHLADVLIRKLNLTEAAGVIVGCNHQDSQ